jgi:hypothetical protein
MKRSSESSLVAAAIAALGVGLVGAGCSAADTIRPAQETSAQGVGATSASSGAASSSCGPDAAAPEAATSCTACTPTTCSVVTPSNALITDWRDVSPQGLFVDNDMWSAPNPNWWLGFYGSPYVYPTNTVCPPQQTDFPIAQTTNGDWHVTGTVGDWSGFGLWFGACTVDMSAYRGVSFEISGNVGSSGSVTLVVPTGPDSTPNACQTNVGSCTGGTSCKGPSKTIAIPATPGTPIVVLWSDLVGGNPVASPDPSQILGLLWTFDWTDWGGVKSSPYPVDVTVGSISLVQ